jgi:hypothetical protein
MSKAKPAVGVLVGILTLSALVASSATGQWMVNKTTLSGTQTAALATTAAVDESFALKAAGVTVTCSGATISLTSGQLEASGEMFVIPDIVWDRCSANENCSVPLSLSTTALLVDTMLWLLGNTKVVGFLDLPKTKTTIATIKFEGEKCALLGTQPVSGKIKMQGPTGGSEATLQLIEVNALEATEELKVGSSAAEFKGKALLKLASGAPWSFLLP